jgi:hypothetical protein
LAVWAFGMAVVPKLVAVRQVRRSLHNATTIKVI